MKTIIEVSESPFNAFPRGRWTLPVTQSAAVANVQPIQPAIEDSAALMAEWNKWSDAIWNSFHAQFPDDYRAVAMCHIEQKQFRSRKEKRCINCGDCGSVQCETHIIKSVPHYFMCQACADYYANKN